MRIRGVILILIAISVFGFALRVWQLPKKSLTFGYDQARDAFVVQEILHGDLKILGPPASTPGMYHGVAYYYFLLPGYWLGRGNPVIAAYYMATLNAALGTAIIFSLAYFLRKNLAVGFLAAIFWAVSFEANQYATWLSNPTLGAWSVPLIYLGLWLMIKESKRWAIWMVALGVGISIQAEIFLAYHLLPAGIWLWLGRKKINKKMWINLLAGILIILSTMIMSEFKFGWSGLKALPTLANGEDSLSHSVSGANFGDFTVLYLNQLGRAFTNNLFAYNSGYGGALGTVLIAWLVVSGLKNKTEKIFKWQWFLLSFILSHASIVSVGGNGTPFLMVGIGGAVVILASIALLEWRKNQTAVANILIALTVLSNVAINLTRAGEGSIIFSIQKDMLLSKQLAAIDYTYEAAGGEMFSINSLTSPLWINTVWSYLYNWHGFKKYGYLPEWHGRDQVGRLGNNLANANEETQNYFFIIEPERGIPENWFTREQKTEADKAYLKLIERKNWGEVEVEWRRKK